MKPIAHNERLHAMDALRAIAMLLGVVLHAALSYEADAWPEWPFIDESRNLAFDYIVGVTHQFRMELFFLVAGFFGCMLIRRYGVHGFVIHRFKRIAVPFIVASLTILPIILMVAAWCSTLSLPVDERPGVLAATAEGMSELGLMLVFLPWHLWFLRTLLVLYVVSIIAWRMAENVPAIARFAEGLTNAWIACVRRGLAAPVLSVGALALLLMQPGTGAGLDAMYPFPLPGVTAYYGFFFGAGWLLYHRRETLPSLGTGWIVWLLLGVGLAGWYSHLQPPFGEEAPVPALQLEAIGAASTGPLVIGFTGLFLYAFQKPSRVMRYLSDSAYWVYIVHLPIVIWFAALFRGLDAGAVTKFTLVMLASCALMYSTYHVFVRYTIIGVMLNGPAIRDARRRARARSPVEPVAASDDGAHPKPHTAGA